MNQKRWLTRNLPSLAGKTVAVTGATGGLGREICRGILTLGGSLILLARNPRKLEQLKLSLLEEFPGSCIRGVMADLSDLQSVSRACRQLLTLEPDILVHNAGAYKIPRKTCSTGLDNVFQINFASPYYMTRQLLPMLSRRRGKVVVMGSVACSYSLSDPGDPDFHTRSRCHLVYGNSKRYLMFAFSRLMARWPQVDFAIAHPGITVTAITAHYPKPLYALIRYPMKIIFMHPPAAARGMLRAICQPVPPGFWMGPRFFRVWGNPAVSPLPRCNRAEQQAMDAQAQRLYAEMMQSECV